MVATQNLFIIFKETDTYKDLSQFTGRFTMHCEKYGTAEVKVQKRGKLGTWSTMRYNGAEVKFSAVGDTIDIEFLENYDYQLIATATGAFITMDRSI